MFRLKQAVFRPKVLLMVIPIIFLLAIWSGGSLASQTEGQPEAYQLIPAALGPPSGLFVDAANTANLKAPTDPTIMRSRFVDVQFNLLSDASTSSKSSGKAKGISDQLSLNLFNDAGFTASLDHVQPAHSGGYIWTGQLDNVKMSQVVLVVKNGVMMGNISSPAGIYQIRHAGGSTHAIYQIDQSAFPADGEPLAVTYSEAQLAEAARAPMADDGSTIDILVVYTADARSGEGGTANMETLIDLAVAETNQSYANSGITQRLNLVHTAEVVYTEAGNIATDRDRLKATADGNMDNVHTLRDTYAADVVTLIVENGGGYCGIAYIMTTVSAAFEDSAFNVTARSCATGYYSFGHELGHIMSARHDWYVDPTDNSPYTYNHAYLNIADQWRTVMGYNNECTANSTSCTRLQYWSNPDVTYGGDPMGIAEGTANAADNHKTLNNTALTVANFRQSLTLVTDGDIVYSSVLIDDNTTGNSSGNDDGVANCGETVELFPELMYNGTVTANDVTAVISTPDSFITWLYNTDSSYGNMAGGTTAYNTNDFDFYIDPSTPDGHTINFTLAVDASNGGPWSVPFSVPVTCAPASETYFIYQGTLSANGSPVNNTCDFEFNLYTDKIGGAQINGTVSRPNVEVESGQFIVDLDFGADAFTGDILWLETEVQCFGDAAMTALSPRQALAPAPYALHARAAESVPMAGSGYAQTAARSDHDHLDQIWTGVNTPLVVEGSFGTAPLTLNNSDWDGLRVTQVGGTAVNVGSAQQDGYYVGSANYDGFQVNAAGDNGIEIHSAGNYGAYLGYSDQDGVWVYNAEDDGFYVSYAGDEGLYVGSSGGDGAHVYTTTFDGFEVDYTGDAGFEVYSAGGDGLRVWNAGADGVYVGSAGNDGIYVNSAAGDGFDVDNTGDNGVEIGSTGWDGVYIGSTTFDGFQVDNAGDNGVEVNSASADGVRVGSATSDGLQVDSAGNNGVYVASADNYGVYAYSSGVNSAGVLGRSTATSNGRGVIGWADGASDRGVWGLSSGGYAGYFSGNTHVAGTLSKSAGSFKIDHPLDPENKYLSHSFVESPDMMNVYNGNVVLDANGEAWVDLPAWFEALNQDFRYQLTAIGAPGPNLYIGAEIAANRFKIAGGQPNSKVSWQVTGVRHDPYAEQNRILVEEDKPAADRGTYLHPDVYGQPPEKGSDYLQLQNINAAQDSLEQQETRSSTDADDSQKTRSSGEADDGQAGQDRLPGQPTGDQ